MRLTKKKLLKSTVAKIMAAAMVVSMIPAPINVSAEENNFINEFIDTENKVKMQGEKEFIEALKESYTNGVCKLDKDYKITQSTFLMSGELTIDLNGQNIDVDGGNVFSSWSSDSNLTITDLSAGKTGTIQRTNCDDPGLATVQVSKDSSLTFKSGTIKNDAGYGVSVFRNGHFYVTGGTISSKLSAISGNNTDGDMNIYVSENSQLTAEQGPAIYKPSGGDLFIGNNAVKSKEDNQENTLTADNPNSEYPILTGGVSVRMGNIKISGGTFESFNGKGESGDDKNNCPATDYYEQNAAFPDAFFAMGGTYDAATVGGEKPENAINDLKVEIAGGKFTCNNDKGSAVAIYDFDRKKQLMDVKITGGEFIKTKDTPVKFENEGSVDKTSENRGAFNVLNLNDMTETGDTNDINVSIKGGNFTEPESIKSESYVRKYFGDTGIKEDDTDKYCYGENGNTISVGKHELKEIGETIEIVAHKKCETCYRLYVNDTNVNEYDIKLHKLSLKKEKEQEHFTVSFDDNTTTASYGKYKNAPEKFTISPQEGYVITKAPTVTSSDTSIFTCGNVLSDGKSNYTCDITSSGITDSQNLKDCTITVSNVETKPSKYNVSFDRSKLSETNADVYFMKGTEKVTANTINGIDASNELYLVVEPKSNKEFTAQPEITPTSLIGTAEATNHKGYKYKVNLNGYDEIDVKLQVSGTVTDAKYNVSFNRSELLPETDADVYFMKGTEKVTGNTIAATASDELYVVIASKNNKTFDKDSIPDITSNSDSVKIVKPTEIENGVYKYKVTLDGYNTDVQLMVKGNVIDAPKPSEYSVSFNRSELLPETDADVYFMKGTEKVTGNTIAATANDELYLVVEPKSNKTFDKDSLPDITSNSDSVKIIKPTGIEDGVYKYKVTLDGYNDNVQLTVKGSVVNAPKPSEYSVSFDRSKLSETDADVYFMKGTEKVTGNIITAAASDELYFVVEPKAWKIFTEQPKVTPDIASVTITNPAGIENGVYKYKVTLNGYNDSIKLAVSGTATDAPKPEKYAVSFDRSSLLPTDYADVYFIKGTEQSDTDTIEAAASDELYLVIAPKPGKVFDEVPAVTCDSALIIISSAKIENGVYKYKVTLDGYNNNVKLMINGSAKDAQYKVTLANNISINNASAKLDFEQVAYNGTVKLTITPTAGYKILSSDVKFADDKVCKLSEAVQGANGVIAYTISNITGDVVITSITTTTDSVELVESGTETETNFNGANLSDTFANATTDEEKVAQKENHDNILSAVKDAISDIDVNKDVDLVIFTNNKLSAEEKVKLVEEIKEAIKEDTSKIALSLEVLEIQINNADKEKEIEENKEVARRIVMEKNTNSNSTVTIGEKFYPLDISLFAQVIKNGNVNNDVKIKLTDTQKGKITIKMNIPKNMPSKQESAVRKYYIVRFHKDKNGNESREVIDVKENKDGTLSFESDKFSTYILCYTDEVPKTTQNNNPVISGGGTSTVYTPSPAPSSAVPTASPTASVVPSGSPTAAVSSAPTQAPSLAPAQSSAPSQAPSTPSQAPDITSTPSTSTAPNIVPTAEPNGEPTAKPMTTVKVNQKVTAGVVKYKVTSVGNKRTVTVSGSKSVKNVVIPASIKIGGKTYKVTAIESNAFKNNKKLRKITIGSNISKINKKAFYGCTNLKNIVIKTTKLTANKIGKNAFKGINKRAIIKVPKSKVKAYKKIIMAHGVAKSVKIR